MPGLVDQVLATQRRRQEQRRGELAWPVGTVAVEPFDTAYGHDTSQFAPDEYGDYLATSNEIFAAANLRARLASSIEMRLYRGRRERKREMPNSPAAALLEYVNPHWTPARLARMDELAMCIFGETMWGLHYQGGQPAEIWWLKPSRMTPVPDEHDYLSGWWYESSVRGQRIWLEPHEVVWHRYPNLIDEFSPLSPLAAARLAADTGKSMMKANRNLHDQGVQIAGLVSPVGDRVRFTKDQAEQLEDDIARRFSGTRNAHKWGVLRYEAKFMPVTMSPKDAEFVLGLGLTLRQVANAYGIPSPLLNDLEHATLANLREFQKAIWEHALVPDLEMKAQEIREQLLPRFPGRGPDQVEPDFSRVAALQESRTAAWDRERQAIEVGALTINEWRLARGMPPVPWGDAFWAPVNKAPVNDANGLPGVVEPADESGGAPGRDGAPPDEGQGDDEALTRRGWMSLLDALGTDLDGDRQLVTNGYGGA
ncbi:phage portal protein [Actinokineospora sp. UTMC 2448]|uniref:phage portal protein n=1 Tax=Actinokineospora sp. UTMC 2448 TaxID=2268449 RepID=UPI0021640AB4|nr:phage portal protein [Actinokineospora sp. UTMC 2448]UVS81835.1 phage portal protein, HK97 family [Actinokineospora sp. UTMC 2448]